MGRFTRKIVVNTNDPAHTRELLTCIGHVLVPLKMSPRSANFGKVARDAPTQHKTVEMRRGDGGPVAPTLARTRGQGIDAKLREIAPGERYALDVTVSPPWPNGPLRGSIVLDTGVPEASQMTLPVSANIQARLEATPSTFRVTTRPRSGIWQTAILKWNGGPPGKILDVSCNDPHVSVTLQEASGRQQLVLRVPPGYEPARETYTVTVCTDDEEVPTLRIPVRYTTRGKRVGPAKTASRGRPGVKQPSPGTKAATPKEPKPAATTQPAPR